MSHAVTIACLAIGVVVTLIASLGIVAMGDTFERLHFMAPMATITPAAIAVAVFVADRDAQARIKVVLVTLLLVVANSVVTHATARAARIRRHGRWEARDEELERARRKAA